MYLFKSKQHNQGGDAVAECIGQYVMMFPAMVGGGQERQDFVSVTALYLPDFV